MSKLTFEPRLLWDGIPFHTMTVAGLTAGSLALYMDMNGESFWMEVIKAHPVEPETYNAAFCPFLGTDYINGIYANSEGWYQIAFRNPPTEKPNHYDMEGS